MNNKTHSLITGIALLLVGLSLATAVTLTASYTVRADPGVLYAAPTAQGSGNCSGWDNACTLQTALTDASNGDEIWVKAGVHYPGSMITDTFTLQSGVALYGGFAGTETSRDERDWGTNLTVLSGDIDQNDLTDPTGVVTTTVHITGTNAYHVVTSVGVTETAVLDGFVITAGQANGDGPHAAPCDGPYCGGGMYNEGGDPVLANLAFTGNTSNWGGGGMFNNGSSPSLTNVTFRHNTSTSGGGIFNNFNTHPILTNVSFTENSAVDSGGGMYNQFANPTLTNVTFSDNSSDNYGGGMQNYSSSPTLTNVTFSGNTAVFGAGIYNYDTSSPILSNVTFSSNLADLEGGGMYNIFNSSPTLTNVTFSGNTARYGGGGMSTYYSSPTLTNVTFSSNTDPMQNYYSSPTLTNVIVWGNINPFIYNYSSTPQISYSDIQGCSGSGSWNSACGTDGGGNIEADPLFADAASGDLRLQLTSPTIDAGTNAALLPDILTDLDGNPRFVDIPIVPDTGSGAPPIVDMGTYEAQYVDVALSKAVLPPTAAPGEPITFTLVVSNTGSLPASGIVVTDTLPAWLWDVSITSTLDLTDTGYLPPSVWQVQDLAPGQGGVITIRSVLTVPLPAGVYTNTAFITATGDLLADNNTAVITFTVPNVAPVFTSAPVIMATEAASYTYTATTQDDNGDALTITAPTLPGWLTLTDYGDGTATLSGTPTNANVGEHAVVLLVTDSGGLTDTQTFTVTVWGRTYLPLVLRNTP